MKRFGIKKKIFIAIILIAIIGYTTAVSAQNKILEPFSYPSYIPSHLGSSIFGNILYTGLNWGFFSSRSSVVPNFLKTPLTSSMGSSFLSPSWSTSVFSSILSPSWSSSKVPSFSSPSWTPSYSASPSSLYTSLLGSGFTSSSYERPSVNPLLDATSFYTSPSLYVSPYSPVNGIGWQLTTPYLRTDLWAWPANPSVEKNLDQLWDKIHEAIENGLSKTAIEYLKKFIPKALKKERYGLAMKAICKQLVLEANIQGDKPEEKIKRLTEEIEKAPDLLKPLLKLILAQWYWQYYQENRWRFSERDATADIDDEDFTTWDLPRLFDKIDELYTEVLSQEEQLKSMSIA